MTEEVFPGEKTAPGKGHTLTAAVADARQNASTLVGRDVPRVQVIYQELAATSPEMYYVIVRIPQF